MPFYWGRLVSKPEFRELLKNCVSWAMVGSSRFNTLYSGIDDVLEEESSRLTSIQEAGDEAVRRSEQSRTYLLLGLWTVAIIFQGFLVVRFIIPRFRSEEE